MIVELGSGSNGEVEQLPFWHRIRLLSLVVDACEHSYVGRSQMFLLGKQAERFRNLYRIIGDL